jgi:hypothetical protein
VSEEIELVNAEDLNLEKPNFTTVVLTAFLSTKFGIVEEQKIKNVVATATSSIETCKETSAKYSCD